MSDQICPVEGCNSKIKTIGYCNRHSQQIWKHGKIIRTKYDLNEIEIGEHHAFIHLYNKKGEFVTKSIIDLDDVEKVKSLKWMYTTNGYVENPTIGKIHNLIMGVKARHDHKNNIRLDNRKENLRPCTNQENAFNMLKPNTNTSGAKGVSWEKRRCKFEAYITCGKRKFLGYYTNVIDAAEAYNKAALELFGEFAKINDIEALKLKQQAAQPTNRSKNDMAMLPQTFTAKVVDPAGTSTQLPLGDHPVVITASEMKQVKDKPNCGYLELTLHVIDGPASGMDGSYRLNLYHQGEPGSEQTVAIAEKQLSAIAHVTGNVDPSGRCTAVDSSQFHNVPFIACVTPQKNKADFTQVSAVKHIGGEQPGKAGNVATNAAPVAPPMPPVQQPVQPQAPVQAAAPAWGAPVQPAAPAAPVWGAPAAPEPVQQAQPAWAAPQQQAPAAAPPWGAK